VNVSDLREILQYVPRFRGRVFVIAVDGSVAASENFANLLLDLAVLRSLSIKVILVHGAGAQTRKIAEERGFSLSNDDGTGVTDEATLQAAIDAGIRLTHEVLEGLSSVDLRAAYCNAIIAHPAGILGGVDQLWTGRVERVDYKQLNVLLGEGVVPVVPPLGFDGEGRTFRVNSDAAAVEVAEAMQAAKVIFLYSDPGGGVRGALPRQLSIAEAQRLSQAGRLPRGLVSKLEHGARACREGIPRVHLLDGEINEAMLTEIFSNEGYGTMIYSNEYQQIRRIFKKDVRSVMALIQQSVDSEELVRRNREEILAHIEDYWILEVDRNPVACVALHAYPEERVGELACLYVHRNHENQGYGRKLMGFVEDLARQKELDGIFALSTQAFNYLQQKGGFRESGPEVLPAVRRAKYDESRRNSRVLYREL